MEEKYKDKWPEYYKRFKKKQLEMKWGIINPNIVDEFETRVIQPTPAADEGLEKWEIPYNVRKKAQWIAEQAQKEVRKEWAQRGNVNNIIIIEPGPSKKDIIYYQCEIHQLRMDAEKRREFEEVCNEIISKIDPPQNSVE